MKKFVNLLLVGGMVLVFNTKANATTSYVNENGVAIDNNVVEALSDVYASEKFNYVTQKEYNDLYFIYENGYSTESKLIGSRSLMRDGEAVETYSGVLTEEEYEQAINIEPYATCEVPGVVDCWMTDYKLLTLTLSRNDSNKTYIAMIENEWLQTPKVKSNDVIAMRYNNIATISDFYGSLKYKLNGTNKSVQYNTGHSNNQKFSWGCGITMGLVASGTNFDSLLIVSGTFGNSNMNIYGSYQHATTTVSLTDAKNYTTAADGLGGVIKFNSTTIKNKYDAMEGVVSKLEYNA